MNGKNILSNMMKAGAGFLLLALTVTKISAQNSPPDPLRLPEEKHLKNIRQLTFDGENAEAYFSADDSKLIFQYHQGNDSCDQIYTMNIDGTGKRLVSTGKGRCTCGYFFPDGGKILFSSTHLADSACPPKPDYSKGYVWPLYTGYDIFTANPDGTNRQRLTTVDGYDAERSEERRVGKECRL